MRVSKLIALAVILLLMLTTGAALAAVVSKVPHSQPGVVPAIKIILPNGGQNLELGMDAAIAWTYNGLPATATVRLSLVKEGIELGEIANNVPIQYSLSPAGNGSLPSKWKVGSYLGGTVEPGSGYKIRIRVNGFAGQDESDSAFNIVPPGPARALKLTSPNGGEKWEQGKTATITWTSTGIAGPVRLVLTKGGVDRGIIGKPNAATGSFEWNIGALLPPDDKKIIDAGSDYKVRIETLDRSVSDESSHSFSLSGPALKPPSAGIFPHMPKGGPKAAKDIFGPKTITVTGPAAGTALNRIGAVDIHWQYTDNLKSSFVKILLFKAGTEPEPNSYVIEGKWPILSGKYHWNLPGPEGIELGAYRIRVQSLSHPEVYGDSQIITFTAKERSFTVEYNAVTSNHEMYFQQGNGMQGVLWDTGAWPDPGPGNVRVGYNHTVWNKNGSNSYIKSYLYRSFIRFDLKGLTGNEKVKWAKLSYIKNDKTPDAPRPLYALDLPWNKSASDLFSIGGTPVNPQDVTQMRDLVQRWIYDPSMNFGLVMTGPDENMKSNGSRHIMILTNVKLEIGLSIVD